MRASGGPWEGRRYCFILLLVCVLWALNGLSPLRAESQESYLLHLLRDSDAFRVRVQAALSLGRLPKSAQTLRGLTHAALRDPEPSVRMAAATSLARVGDKSTRSSFQKLMRDPDRRVRETAQRSLAQLQSRLAAEEAARLVSPGARFYVRVGKVNTNVTRISGEMLQGLEQELIAQLKSKSELVVAPQQYSLTQATQLIQRHSLTGYALKPQVLKLVRKAAGSARAEISIIVESYPGSEVRMVLSGSATVSEASSDEEAEQVALTTACQSALSRFYAALGQQRSPRRTVRL